MQFHAVSVMTQWPMATAAVIRDRKDVRFLPHPIRKQCRLTVTKATKRNVLTKEVRLCVEKTSCKFWHVRRCHFRHVAKKGGAKGSVAILKSIQAACQSQDSHPRENLFYGKTEYWDRNTPSNSPKTIGTKLKFGKERAHREELSKSVRHMSVVLARQNSRKDDVVTPCTKKDAPAEQRGIWRNIFIYKLMYADEATFYAPI